MTAPIGRANRQLSWSAISSSPLKNPEIGEFAASFGL
jgi:hypothetical protein